MLLLKLTDYYSQVFSLIHPLPLDEFSFKEIRTCGQSKVSSLSFLWCKSREFLGRRSPRFPTPMVKSSPRRTSTSYKKLLGKITFGIHTLTKCQSAKGASPACFLGQLPDYQPHAFGLSTQQMSSSIKSYWTELDMEFCQTSAMEELLLKSMWHAFK